MFGMVWTANVMILIKTYVGGREGDEIRMRGGYDSAVQWILNPRGQDCVRADGMAWNHRGTESERAVELPDKAHGGCGDHTCRANQTLRIA